MTHRKVSGSNKLGDTYIQKQYKQVPAVVSLHLCSIVLYNALVKTALTLMMQGNGDKAVAWGWGVRKGGWLLQFQLFLHSITTGLTPKPVSDLIWIWATG